MKMSLNLCSSSSETTVCSFKGFGPVAKDFRRICYSFRKESIHVPNTSIHKALVSGSLIPEQLEGTYVRQKRLKEVVPKLGLVTTLLIDNYDSYAYNIYQEFSVVNKLPPVVIHNDAWSLEELLYHIYEEKAFDNIVISPGPGSPTCPADIGICLRLLLECQDIPILGVCLGHQELLSLQYDENDYEGLPFDFHGGFIGYIGHNLKLECGMASNHHKSETPDACFFFADKLVVVDHYLDDVYIISIDEKTSTNTTWLDDIERKLLSLKATADTEIREQSPRLTTLSPMEAGCIAEKSRDQYTKDVDCCMKYITDGESYELCYTTQLKKHIGNMDLLGLYLDLRERNPSPYAAWLNFSKESLTICCSSPERFLRLNRYGELEAKPIKGTIARGGNPAEDEQLRMQLQHSEKDQAENLMIVDLLRNDLGQVCEPGSVHVPKLMDVESYATVHTMVSTIRAKKCSDISPVECVRAARGIYSGCIG